MDVVICGAGEVGRHSAEVLGSNGNNITVIDLDPDKLAGVQDELDVRTLLGNATQADVLREAGVADTDLFIAATRSDEINLLAGAVAKALGARRVITRVHHSAFFEERGLSYRNLLGIDHLVCPDYTTATAIAQTLRSPGAQAVERFAEGKIEIQELPVSAESPAAGKSLSAIRMPPGTRLAAVSHDGRSQIPTGATVINAGDVVTLIGMASSFEKCRKLFRDEPPRRTRVFIMGGTALGVWLCRALNSRRFALRLIEADRERCDELSRKLDWVTILHGDPSSSNIFDEEHVEQADAFVALTDDDENNILNAARAKSMGVREAIAVLKRPTYLHLLEHVGIDRAFSPRVTAVNEIQLLLDNSSVRILASLADGIADVYEIQVPPNAVDILNKPLEEIVFPEHSMVAAIQRGDDVRVPGAKDTIAANDRVIMIGPSGMTKRLRRLFDAK